MSGNRFALRTAILVALCLQNTGYTLLRKYSVKSENISSKEILLVGELLKLVVSVWCIFNDSEVSDSQGNGIGKLYWLITNSFKMLVLAAIYGAMNILSFVALQYIGAGEFTICAQLKILTTAGFSVIILGTSLSYTKWRALALLVLGCILVASPNFNSHSSKTEGGASAIGTTAYSLLLGYGAVLLEVCMSGFASIYFEKVVKSTTEKITIWERNFQLSLYSIAMYGGIILYEGNSQRIAWSGWTFVTFSVAVFGALGGLLVAATLKYADSILKTLAVSGAIVLATILGHIFLQGPLDLVISIGACCAIIAIFNYTMDTSLPVKAVVTNKVNGGGEVDTKA